MTTERAKVRSTLLGDPRKFGTSNRVEQVIEFIHEGLKLGRFAPGQRISEVEICEALAVKRGPVREGIRILAGDGVIELIPNRGARIRKLSRFDLGEMISVLTALNEVSLIMACERHSKEKFEQILTPLLKRIDESAQRNDTHVVFSTIAEYHNAIHELGGNQYVMYLWKRLHIDHYHRSFAVELTVHDWPAYLFDYRLAHDAILRGDRQAAARHFTNQAVYIANLLEVAPR